MNENIKDNIIISLKQSEKLLHKLMSDKKFNIPLNFLEEFKPQNVEFKVDRWEELILQDLSQSDSDTRIKLNRNLTEDFNKWVTDKLTAKEQIKICIKGQTRSGKSLIALKIANLTTKFYQDKIFDTEKIVCANQKELRVKLNDCEFGDTFQIDENAFANVGAGSMSEIQQLKDINNIIAKQNIHMVYITPETFLNVGATMGLAYFGKDTKNWVSRFLLYQLRGGMPQLLGYVTFNVGTLFQDTGCFLYKLTGGCTNPKKLKIEDIPESYIKNSSCISQFELYEKIPELEQANKNACPFYMKCRSALCQYEHKKDKWISRELRGGIGERELEKYELALKLFKEMSMFNEETGRIMLSAKNGKELKLKIKMKLPKFTNAKLTGVEIEEIITTIISLTDLEFMKDLCKNIEVDFEKYMEEIYNKKTL